MTYKMYVAFIASLSVAITVASNDTFGASGAVHGGKSASAHSAPSAMRPESPGKHHNERNAGWALWPTAGGFYGPSYVEPNVNVTPSISGDVHYTYTYDVPWDAVHRYPLVINTHEPVVRPYVPGCPAQTVTIPLGDDGKEQTINIVRCY
jgi:hypothetical protein